jgi:hypothetical protein
MAKRINPLLEQEQRKAQQEQLVKQAQSMEKLKKTKMTIMLTEDEIIKAKRVALERKTSVSEMGSEWISTIN